MADKDWKQIAVEGVCAAFVTFVVVVGKNALELLTETITENKEGKDK